MDRVMSTVAILAISIFHLFNVIIQSEIKVRLDSDPSFSTVRHHSDMVGNVYSH